MAGAERAVADHYGRGGLLDRIKAGLSAVGADPDHPSVEDLQVADQFHIGGEETTTDLLDQLDIEPEMVVLDLGCGIGGAARLVASRYGCHVTGIDLTPEFIDCARVLSVAVGLGPRTRFEVANATALPFGDDSFELALLLHVGMNIADKAKLMREAARVLRPRGTFAVFDIMRVGAGKIAFPVPWAATSDTSFVETPAAYRKAAEDAGFAVAAERPRGDFAKAFFAEARTAMQEAGGPPPLGTHLMMGPEAGIRLGNVGAAVDAGFIAPVELILRAPA